MLAFIIGAAFGGAALYCLGLFSKAVTSGTPSRAILPLFGNMGAIGIGLAIPAIWLRDQLMWAGIGLVGALVAGAFVVFAVRTFKKK